MFECFRKMGEKKVGETAGVVAEAGGSLFQSLKDVGAKFYVLVERLLLASKTLQRVSVCWVLVLFESCNIALSRFHSRLSPPPPTPPVQK